MSNASLIEEIEQTLKRALPQLTSIYIKPEKQRDAVVVGNRINERKGDQR